MLEKRFALAQVYPASAAERLKTIAYNALSFDRGRIGAGLRLETLLRLFSLLALRHDRRAKPRAEIIGKFVKLGVAINLDGLFGRIADYVAVVAPSQVVFEFGLGPIIEGAV
jgi:hypothetical protein